MRISYKFVFKVLIILFWVSIFFSFLYLPRFIHRINPSKSINIFSWTEMFDQAAIAEFEKQTGIKINIAYYESNEELYAKLRMTKGKGYDLIIPSDYMIAPLVAQGLLQKIDYSKINFFQTINPQLTSRYFDPHNEYSVPYVWSVYGTGYLKNALPVKTDSWGLLLDPAVSQLPRVMIEDMRELILLSAYYLYGSIDGIDQNKMTQVVQLLRDQKKYVVAYTDVGAPYLLGSGQCKLALATSPYIIRIMRNHDNIDFVIPSQGTFMVLENMVISATTQRADLVYQFMNFMYKPEIINNHVKSTYFFSPLANADYQSIPDHIKNQVIKGSFFEHVQFFRNVIAISDVNKAMLELKAY